MQRFRSILVVEPADGTDISFAMERATELALRNGAGLTLTSTVGAVPKRRRKRAEGQGLDLQAVLVDERKRVLDELAERYRSENLAIAVSVDVGVPVIETIRRVLRDGHDLVITPEDAGLSGFGSSTKQLLRRCPCPLWVVRPSRGERLKILAAVDPTMEHGGGALSRMVMDLATSLTIIEGGELHIVHAWAMDGEATLRSSPYVSMSSKEVDLMVEVTHDEHAEGLNNLLSGFDLAPIDHEVHLVKGDPRRVIPGLAVDKDVNLIVMGTVARTGVAGLVIGNTAETMLDALDCSVLAVKPEGFVSPVTLPSLPESSTGGNGE